MSNPLTRRAVTILSNIHLLLAENIKYFRTVKDLTQEELANLTSINRSYLASIEAGQRNVSLSTVEKICGALDITPSEIFSHRK